MGLCHLTILSFFYQYSAFQHFEMEETLWLSYSIDISSLYFLSIRLFWFYNFIKWVHWKSQCRGRDQHVPIHSHSSNKKCAAPKRNRARKTHQLLLLPRKLLTNTSTRNAKSGECVFTERQKHIPSVCKTMFSLRGVFMLSWSIPKNNDYFRLSLSLLLW